jgi:hypothetical protein
MTAENWWALTRWQLARETGWTLEYIDSLTLPDISQYLSVMDGIQKATK